jgi:8-hydroxy-5-deazaflavin:NADPH oxidoreductase
MSEIAILGTGRIGGTLARKWSAAGHRLRLGARDPGKGTVVELANELGATVHPIAEAVDAADAVLFAIPGGSMAATIADLGARLQGKVAIDAANNVRGTAMNSLQAFRENAPGASYARAFNTLGWEILANPIVAGEQASMFYCSTPGAQDDIETLVRDVGLGPVRVGAEDEAEVVDGVLRLWFTLVMKQGRSRRLAFRALQE